jgi:hypothetical protein
VKIAQDQLDNAQGAAEGSAGPQEVVDALVQVIDELTAVTNAIPAEPSNQETEAPGAPAAPTEEPEKPQIGAKVDVKDAKINELTAKVELLNAHLAKEQLAKVAEEYAKAIHNDTRSQQAKFDEIMKSDKDANYWETRLAAIEEFSEANNVNTQFQKPAKNTSFYRVAKQGNNLQELML